MQDLIVIAILLVIVVWAVKESVRHMRGEGGCCGGGSCEHAGKPEKKELSGPVVQRCDFRVEGMHCENCAAKVTRAINAIDGASAEVKLHRKTAHVECDRRIDPEVIIAAIKEKGYEASAI